MCIFAACIIKNTMDLEKQINDIEEFGNDHVGSSSDTPLRPDAFNLSDIEKIAIIKEDVQNILQTLEWTLQTIA